MKKCKHPIKSLSIKGHSDSEPDGYGGNTEWSWNALHCAKCSKDLNIGDYRNSTIDPRKYFDFTGRVLSFEECKKIFVQNKTLYGYLEISGEMDDFTLRAVGKRTDELGKKIEKKKKLLKKHHAQLSSMLEDYYGGEVPFHEKVSLL